MPTIPDILDSAVSGREVAAKVRLYEVYAKKLVAVDLKIYHQVSLQSMSQVLSFVQQCVSISV